MALPTQHSKILPAGWAPPAPTGCDSALYGASSGFRFVSKAIWVWYVTHGTVVIRGGLVGQVEHQVCSVGFVNSKVVTDAIFLLAFAKSPSARWGSERLEAHLIGGQPWTWSCSESVCSV